MKKVFHLCRFKRSFRAIPPKISKQEAEIKILEWRKGLSMQEKQWSIYPNNNPNLELTWLPFLIYSYTGPVICSKKGPFGRSKSLEYKDEKVMVYAEPNYASYMDDIRFQNVPQDEEIEINTDPELKVGFQDSDLHRIAVEHTKIHFEYSLRDYTRIRLPTYVHFDPPELIYFPVYKLVYKYEGHKFLIFVNARNGVVVGDKQNSLFRYSLASFVILTLLHYENLYINPQDFESARALIPVVDAAISFCVGLGFKYYGIRYHDDEKYISDFTVQAQREVK